MTDDFEKPGDKDEQAEEESFARMFENYMGEVKDDLRVGEKISAQIISISDDSVFINTGSKVDGIVDKIELLDENGELPYSIGDTLNLYVVSTSESEIRLSKAFTGAAGGNRLYEAHRNAIPVEGRVAETCKGGVRVNVLGKIAFCPVSQLDVAYVEQPDAYVGNTYEFLITRIEDRGRNIVVSRRDLMARHIEEARKQFIKNTSEGDLVDARITKLMPFGAFAEVAPGVEGMIHISELSWTRVGTPEEAVAVNDQVKVKVLGVETPKDASKPPKISLSIKQALGDPWETVFDKYRDGDHVEGVVTRCADFGAFVQIEAGIEGLVHISEMSHKRVNRPEDVVSPGQKVAVTIRSIDPANRRISLSMKDAEGDPWLGIEDRYGVGKTVTGRIEKKERFGYFIALEPGVVGLLPISKIKAAPNAREIENLRIDDPVTVTVETVNTRDRKLSLTIGDILEADDDWRRFKKDKTSDTGLGGLGEKLKAALNSKENKK